MFDTQSVGSSFERSMLGVLGGSVVCLYVLGAMHFVAPIDALKLGAYELASVDSDTSSGARIRQTKSNSPLMQRVLPAPEIVHQTLFSRPSEDTLVGQIKFVGISLQVVSARDLDRKLAGLEYSLNDIRRGSAPVPRLQVANLPPDLAEVHSAHQRKRLFIKSILPLVLQVSEKILTDRRKLLDLLKERASLSQEDEEWISVLADRYDVEISDMDTLIRRVDVVPPSLAIAQAAAESGWGTSRFAIEANAVFGQWTYRQGSGVVPERRDVGKRHEVKSFTRLRHSVAAYMHNLNIHWAYREFRSTRQELRGLKKPLTGRALAGTLHKYSARGSKYIKTILTIMRVNGLGAFDDARLRDIDAAGLGT